VFIIIIIVFIDVARQFSRNHISSQFNVARNEPRSIEQRIMGEHAYERRAYMCARRLGFVQ